MAPDRKAKAPDPARRRRTVRRENEAFLVAPGGAGNRHANTWAVCYRDRTTGRTRYASTGASDEEGALAFLASWLNARSDETKGRTVNDAIDAHLAELERKHVAASRDPARLAARRSALRHVRTHFGPLEPTAIKPAYVQEYYVRRRRDGVGDRTISIELAYLRAALNYAVEVGSQPYAPKIRVIEGKAKARRRVLSEAELSRLLAALPSAPLHMRLFVMVSIYTGQRGLHVRALRWDHVDLEGGWFRFEQANPNAAANKQCADSRIPAAMREVLTLARAASRSGWLIEWEGKPVKSLKTAWERLCAAADLEDLHIHDLRRSFATLMAKGGVSLDKIADHMNLDRRTLRLHYAHGAAADMLDAMERVEALPAPDSDKTP